MNRVAFAGVDAEEPREGIDRRRLGDALGTTGVAVSRYRIAPGAGFPSGLHAHADQEEVFVVLSGEAAFETLDGEVRVTAGEAVRFAAGEFQTGRNAGDEPLVAIALGAPKGGTDVRLPATCPDCGGHPLRLAIGEAAVGDAPVPFGCPDCGAEHVPAPCPDCGGRNLGFTTDAAARPLVACDDCGSVFDEPPLRG